MNTYTLEFSASNVFSVNRPFYEYEIPNKIEIKDILLDIVDEYGMANSINTDEYGEIILSCGILDVINKDQFTRIKVNLCFEKPFKEQEIMSYIDNPKIMDRIVLLINNYINILNGKFFHKPELHFNSNTYFKIFPITDEDFVTGYTL